jgi:GNAT superfamily N-acetyltransferase
MTQLPSGYVLRRAVHGELPRAIAIDDDAAAIFAAAGIVFDIPDDHPFVTSEHQRWHRALERGDLWFACAGASAEPAGFFALDKLEDCFYLEQLSVRTAHGKRGLGGALLEEACERLRARGALEAWLTTYAHVPWNGPFYARHGFRAAPEAACNATLRAVLEEQRRALPAPEQRIAMVRALAGT